MTAYQDFETYVAQINDLCCVNNLLMWDDQTHKPAGGTETRGHQIKTISEIAQERFTDPKMMRLIESAEKETQGESPDSPHVRALQQTRSAYEIVARIPLALVGEFSAHKTQMQLVWQEARAKDDFNLYAPHLEKMVEIKKKYAEAIGYQAHPYDALLLRYEPDMTAALLKTLFEDLKKGLLPIIQRANNQDKPRNDFLHREYPVELQKKFASEVVQRFGYDMNRGNIGVAPHPFEISFTRNDVRITTRFDPHFINMALFGLFHESGHGMYEQGADPSITRSALTTDFLGMYGVAGVSYGLHESQSRLWENIVGRSLPFWRHYYPSLQATFPQALQDVTLDEFYRAINRVEPSPIRVEADEVTYNFHIMLRVEVEMAMLDGSLKVKDLPEFWREKMISYLGYSPKNNREGALQDIHWASGDYGSFPCYTIGNVMSAQFMEAARKQIPDLNSQIESAEFTPLRSWLTENIYRHGRTFSPHELMVRATGKPLSTDAYLSYIQNKFEDLYPSK